MKELRGISVATAATLALIASQPASANPTQVTNVRLNPTSSGFEVVLETQGGKAPQVFNVNRGNTWNAFVFNAQLSQPFRQDNPAPGIAQVSVVPSGGNGVQVTVVGQNGAPIGQIASRNAQGVVLSVSNAESAPAAATPAKPATPTAPIARMNQVVAQKTPSTPPSPSRTSAPLPTSRTPVAPFTPSAQVPRVTQPAVPSMPVPPLMQRAVAPPVGDQAVSQIDTSPTAIDLGTNERIPRLVLRDAPVREVLSLLARAAGLNLAYSEAPSGQQGQQQPGAKANGPTISLDIENEAVQDVFNYVLRITCVPGGTGGSSSGSQCNSLEANRVGRTVFVGPRLPDEARNIISRTIRLNQVTSADAAAFLTTQGAETQRPFESVEIQTIGVSGTSAARVVEVRRPTILALRATEGAGPLVLKGLSVAANDRLNTITLTGSPRTVDVATRLLGQLDARKRQVALNVKIVDINLLRTDDFNTSFSFGIGNNFFNVDKGAAVFNFGQYRPPTNAESGNSLTGRPTIENPYGDANTFINLDQPGVDVANTFPGTRIVNSGTGQVIENPRPNSLQTGSWYTRSAGVSSNPFQTGVTNATPATPNVITITPGTAGQPGSTAFSAGTLGSVTSALPSLFQFPTRFLARLQSQVTSGNAKVLADPTIVIQDGESSKVRLVEEVFSGFRDGDPIIREAGLILDLKVDRIDDNGFITLRANPEISSPQAPLRTGQGDITLITRRNVESGAIRIRDGQTLILTGIIQERDRSTVKKVPILGDLPLLGSLFRSTTRDNQRQEVIIMLTPQLMDDGDRSNFGYGYVPGKEVRQMLQQQGNR